MELFLLRLFIWSCILYGITSIITESSLFQGVRDGAHNLHPKLGTLLSCPLCTGTWVGVFLSAFFWSPVGSILGEYLVDIERMARLYINHMKAGDDFQGFMSNLGYDLYYGWVYLKKYFLDGMIASTIVWFMHIIERRLARVS